MSAGYSGTPLVKKLGIKDGYACVFHNFPAHYFDLLENLPEIEAYELSKASPGSIDFVHAFVQFQDQFQQDWNTLKSAIRKSGILWVSWPKGKSNLDKDLNENDIRRTGLSGGLVDVKVCAVDKDWSGLKFMYRKEDR